MSHHLRYIAYKRETDGLWGVGLWDFILKKIVDPIAFSTEDEEKATRRADVLNRAFDVIQF
jgi:hypothetical protein